MGSGWAAHFLRSGLEVVCYDPRPEAEEFLRHTVNTAWPYLEKLGLSNQAGINKLSFTTDINTALDEVQFIQESAIEDEEAKIQLLATLDSMVDPSVVIASSSSGFLAANLRSKCIHGGRVIVGHPFNPPYLIPLVEIAGGDGVDFDAINCAVDFYSHIHSKPVVLDNEINGYIGNRLQFAVWKEILYMLSQGVASVEQLDAALTHGPALRWAAIGPSHTFYLGARTPDQYPDFIELLIKELGRGYTAPDDFFPDKALIEQYVQEVSATWGVTDAAELKHNRDSAITRLLQALENPN